jgi:anaerobic selenocysteine-containing dehydrogenase
MEKPFLFSPGWGTPILAGEQVVDPQHQRKSDYELCRDLGRRLGQSWPDSVEDVFDEWLRGAGTTYHQLLGGSRVVAGSTVRSRFQEVDPRTGLAYGFGTPTGRIELHSTVLERLGYDPLPDFDERGLSDDRQFPLWLMTGATRIDATHQDHRHVEQLRRRHRDPTVEIDPRTARAIGAAEGDWLRIVTRDGEIVQRAHLVPGLGSDRVSAERWWYPEREGALPALFDVRESNANAHTSADGADCDQAYGGLPFRNARCRIERVDAPAA